MFTENGKNLVVESKKDAYFVPHINFDADAQHCLIEGESYLEDAFEFYDNLMNWFKEYFKTNQKVVLDCKLSYFNTSSSRALLDLFRLLKEFQDEGKQITINWYYPEEDHDDMRVEGEDFMDESDIHLNIISY
ncbi:DUF1987 domain-containing protein [Bernardetia sp. Wsw4-3y2]|uniref:DUF1987 domain-containing protein n=1 Tax=Bernardetia sp. Wsw4-3y2 TaxID=3127471 RepID=UPI0030CB7042